jgi:hypothetical protein
MIRFVLIFISLTVSVCAFAVEATKLAALEKFEVQKSAILADIKEGVVYKEISYGDLKLVQDTLDLMSANLGSVSEVSEITPQVMTELRNQQELVNTILTMAENDSRQVCSRRGKLGTNFKTTTCESVKDRRQRQEADRMMIDGLLGKVLPASN